MLLTIRVIKLSILSIITTILCLLVYLNPGFKINQTFVIYAVLCILYIFGIVFVCLQRPKVIRYAVLSTVGMLAFGFMLVPLYDVFCDVTGLNGKLDLTVAAGANQGVDLTRSITVEFVVNHNQEMPWEFKPQHHSLIVHPGQLAKTAYYARNTSKRTMRSQAIPSIAPSKASKYFKKVECFCFNSQKLGPGESAHLGLQFYLDQDLPKDIKRLTLAYTLFDITDN